MDPSILQKIIDGFDTALAPGLAALRPVLLYWLAVMVFLELLRVCHSVMLDGHRADHLGKFVIKTGILASAYFGFPSIVSELYHGFVRLGLLVGGDALTVEQFLDPGQLLAVGIRTGLVLKNMMVANSTLLSAVYFLPYFLCWVLYVLAYAVMAANVLMIQVELSIAMPVALLALVMIFWAPTRNMASGVLSYALNVCFRFFLKAILASIISVLAPILAPPIASTTAFATAIEQAVIMVIAAGILAVLFLFSSKIVGNMLSGTPTLTAGAAFQSGAMVAGLASGGTTTVISAGRAAAHYGARGINAASGGRLALPVVSPPRVPVGRTLQQTLQNGARYLHHDHGHGGTNVNL